MKNPNCFVLLAQISIRAKRTDLFNVYDLKKGEALLGDYKTVGLTRQMYRNALRKLVKWQFVTTQATNRGTVVKLIDTSVFDINLFPSNHQDQATTKQPSNNHQEIEENSDGQNIKKNSQATIKQPSGNHQATTNKNVKNVKNVVRIKDKDKDKVSNAINEGKTMELKKQIIQEEKQRKLLHNEKISIVKAYKNKSKGQIDPKVKDLIKKIEKKT